MRRPKKERVQRRLEVTGGGGRDFDDIWMELPSYRE